MKCPTCAAQIADSANFCPSCGRLVRQASRPQEAGTTSGAGTASRARIPTWLIVLIVAGALFVVGIPFFGIAAAILIPNFMHARALSQMAADQANLRQIAVAVEEYAIDHSGRYPERLAQLQPTYIKSIPEVPGSGGAYTYRRLAPPRDEAAYVIWDDGSMDATMLVRLKGCDGRPSVCRYVAYDANRGITGLPRVPTR
jgi:zinc ribbon protein